MPIVSVQQGRFEGPRYSEREGVMRHFSDYEPDEMRALFASQGFQTQTQSTDPGTWHATWLATVGVAV